MKQKKILYDFLRSICTACPQMVPNTHIWGAGRQKLARLGETPVLLKDAIVLERGKFF